jgi:hypothetical protein
MNEYLSLALAINLVIIAVFVCSFVLKREGNPNRFFHRSLEETPARFGVQLGWKLSFFLSVVYAFLGVFVIETFIEPSLGNFLIVWAMGSPIIFAVAILPAVIIGVVTGAGLSLLVSHLRERISTTTSFMLGFTFCIGMMVLVHLIFNVEVRFSFVDFSANIVPFGIYGTYPFFIGLPSIIYVLSGGWASYNLFKRFEAGQE